MALTKVSIRLDTRLADEAKKILGVKSRSEAVRIALQQVVDAHRASKLAARLFQDQDVAVLSRFM
jgi:Arc/MetJ family transcription regulator